MSLHGFSTGALALRDFRRALRLLRGVDADAVELSALRETELPDLMQAAGDLDLSQFPPGGPPGRPDRRGPGGLPRAGEAASPQGRRPRRAPDRGVLRRRTPSRVGAAGLAASRPRVPASRHGTDWLHGRARWPQAHSPPIPQGEAEALVSCSLLEADVGPLKGRIPTPRKLGSS
jgi:hypothetical protein